MNPANTDKAVRFAEMARHVDEGIRALERRALRDAIAAFERAYQVAKEADLGTDAMLGTLRNLALARREAGDHQGAVAAYRLALHAHGITDRQKAAVLHGLGVIYLRVGAYSRAKTLLTRAHALWQRVLKENTPTWQTGAVRTECVRVALDLSRTLRSLGRYDDARCLLQPILDNLTGVDPSEVPHAYIELARIAQQSGHLKEARRHLDQALSFTHSDDPGLQA
ncbi:MAG: tetratricopeptide repeat protein, partial [Bacillota bacterium]